MDAFLDQGNVATTLESDVEGAGSRIVKLLGLASNIGAISQQLFEGEVKSFAKSFDALLASISKKWEKVLWNRQQP